MNESTDLKTIEQRIFLSYHQDGLLDLCLGGALVQMAVIIFLFPSFFGGMMASSMTWVFAYIFLKKDVTIPRLGYVEFAYTRREKSFMVIFALFAVIFTPVVGVLLVLLLVPNSMPLLEANYMLILAACGLIALSAAGYYSGIRRFYVYGLLLAVLFVLSNFWLHGLFIPLGIVGFLSLNVGVVLLILFVRQFPKSGTNEGGKVAYD